MGRFQRGSGIVGAWPGRLTHEFQICCVGSCRLGPTLFSLLADEPEGQNSVGRRTKQAETAKPSYPRRWPPADAFTSTQREVLRSLAALPDDFLHPSSPCVFRWPLHRQQCCHHGVALAFGAQSSSSQLLRPRWRRRGTAP